MVVMEEDQVKAQPCWLLTLPDELRLNIGGFLDRKRDLYNLSLTSRAGEDMVLAKLYAKVDVEVPQDGSSYSTINTQSLLRAHIVRAVRELSVRNGPMNFRISGYNRRRRPNGGCVDCSVREIIDEMPQGQLTSFSFLHRTQLSPATLRSLAARHISSLRTLQVYEFEPSEHDVYLPTSLTTLECPTIGDGAVFGRIVDVNKNHLRRLRFGQEKEVAEKYRQTRVGFLEQIPQPSDVFRKAVQLQNLPNLRELDLSGIDLNAFTPTDVDQALYFCKLTRLSLESCSGIAAFLEALAGGFFYAQNPTNALEPRIIPQLTHFLFRCEAPTNAVKEALIRFLASFRGLRTLSLLFENASLLEGVAAMIAEHGPTLHSLALESRIQPRESLSLDTSRPFGVGGFSEELWEQSINDICRLCPNLVELGIGFPWGDETVRLRKTLLPTLQNLKTVHIRNFPESQILSQIGEYTVKEYATKFIEWVFPPSKGGSRPGLETLAIGPTIYESRWNSNGARRQPPEFLRTHYFCLDFGKTRFGRWSPMITSPKTLPEVSTKGHVDSQNALMDASGGNALKRPRFESNSNNPPTIIELSSDSDSPPPAKRQKSTTPLHVNNGFHETHKKTIATAQASVPAAAKPASSVFTASGFTEPRSRATPSPKAQTKLTHFYTPKAQNHRPEDGTQSHSVGATAAWPDIPNPGVIVADQGGELSRSHQSQRNGFQGSSVPRTSQNPILPTFSKPVPQPETDRDTEDEGSQILRNFTKPVPFPINVYNQDVESFGAKHGLPQLPLSQDFSDRRIAIRPSLTPRPSAKPEQELLSTPNRSTAFTLEVPLAKDFAPVHLRPGYIAQRKKLLKELKRSTKPAVDRLPEVEKFFGQTGFSAAFPTDDRGRSLRAAPKMVRAIDRSTTALDWGDQETPVDTDAFDMSSLIHPIEQVKAVLTNRFNEQHSPPITFANDVNDRRLNGKFQFVKQYIIQPGVKLSAPKPALACNCQGTCYLHTCKCLAKEDDEYQSVPVLTYTQSPQTGTVVLSDSYILHQLDPISGNIEISECNEFCGCDHSCWNRVVERGRTLHLEIFETAKCGFGVRSSQNIIKGQFIELYLGEVITQQELERRENAKEEGASSYIFCLDFFKGPTQECYHVDGENFGTAMRFVNHSCNPNARSFTVVRNKNDRNVHYVAFFAIRDIESGEEICIDYQNAVQVEGVGGEGGEGLVVEGEVMGGEDSDGRSRCYCGAANCRKWLWPQKVRKRKKRKTTKHD